VIASNPLKTSLKLTITKEVILKRILILCFLLLLPLNQAYGMKLKTKYTIVNHQSISELKQFEDAIAYDPDYAWYQFDRSTLDERVVRKVDAVYKRVQKILGMYKRSCRVNINLYPNKTELHIAYMDVHDTQQYPSKLRAWYTHKTNTIYLNTNALTEGMLAHEMAHAIVDHYLGHRLPRNTAEILARYVDKHLYY